MNSYKIDTKNKNNKGKAYYVISSFDKIESNFIDFKSDYILFNPFSDKFKTKSIPDHYKENESYYKTNKIDFYETGMNSRFFELFFDKEINNREILCIKSVGLSYSSIKSLTNFYYQKFKSIENKTLFFIHNIEPTDESGILIVEEIKSGTSEKIEMILKNYKQKVRSKKLNF